MANNKENYQRDIKELLKELAKLIFAILRVISLFAVLILMVYKLIRG